MGALRRIAEEQAALRRLAVLVAKGESPEEVFAAIAAEAGQVLHAQHAWIGRYDPDGTLSVVAAWPRATTVPIPVGGRISSGGRNLITLVLQTGRPARLDDYINATGAAGALVRESGIRASVGAPVSVDGRLWGLMAVTSSEKPLPAGTEARLAAFTELAATAIANAQFAVAEALTNTAKHAHASIIDVRVESGEGVLHVCVRDNGRGGAHFGGGSGLEGLKDRVEALSGRLSLDSPPGKGTALDIVLPVGGAAYPASTIAGQGG